MTGTFTRVGIACLGFVCLNLAGCATLRFPWEKPVAQESARNPVVQIVCLWEASEGKNPEGKACRGFAGQILFLGNKGGTPVVVDGTIRVKEFDQFTGPAEEAEPFHQFDFDAKSWKVHMHNGTLGPTYHVFIPYMRKGNHDATCELVVEYTPSNHGAMITSTVPPILLKGKLSAKDIAAAHATESLVPRMPIAANERGVRTTTIPLNGRGATPADSATNDPVAARLERMERIMQDFAAQQTAKPATRSIESEPTAPPVAAGQRFSLNGRRNPDTNIVQTAAAQVDADRAETSASTPNPRRHLLSAHPLAAEENSATANSEANLVRSPARRHPLADEPAFAKNGVPQHRNTPPATLVVPEELSDAPTWTREADSAGHATLGDELDGKTTLVP